MDAKLYSYVVARDYGFAPNPFFGICTLATCKPMIREAARIGDFIVGTGSKRYELEGRLVYFMRVTETVTYDQYWSDNRFLLKRPCLTGSLKQAYGDNIYHSYPRAGRWLQENSHHSLPNGRPNEENIRHDTQTNRVLISNEFTYWGKCGPKIPARFRNYHGVDICHRRGHKSNFPSALVASFVTWMLHSGFQGYIGPPKEFR